MRIINLEPEIWFTRMPFKTFEVNWDKCVKKTTKLSVTGTVKKEDLQRLWLILAVGLEMGDDDQRW